MPIVPTFNEDDLPQVQRTGPQIDIQSAGVAGQALARDANSVSDYATAYAVQYQDAQNFNWVSNSLSDYATSQNAALEAAKKQATQTGDYKGAITSFNQQLWASRQALLGQAPSSHAADAFTRHTAGTVDTLTRQANEFADQGEWSAWQSNSQASLSKLSTLSYQNPSLADENYANGLGIIKGAQAAGIGGNKVDWTKLQQSWAKENYGAVVRHQVDTDPNGALAALRGGKFDFVLNPDEVEAYAHQAQNASDRLAQQALVAQERSLAIEAHQDAVAQRLLRQTQAGNEANLLADAVSGKPIDTNHLADLVRAQQISPEGMSAVLRGQEGRDDPATQLHLYQQLGSGQLQPADIMSAVANHTIKASTGVELQRGLNEMEKSGTNQVERSAFSTLKTALGGGAIEQGIDVLGAGKAQTGALWAQAQGEWNRRVIINHEDPSATLADMMPRYSPKATLPTWLPQPQLGAITSPDDIPKLIQQTQAARASGQISADQYAAQGQLIKSYDDFFKQKATRDGAAASVRSAAKAPSTPNAAPAPLSPAGDQ